MRSRVRRSISPEFEKSLVWYPVYEEWYEGSIALERGFMYFFLDSKITDFFATVFFKDERIFVTTTVRQGKSSKKYLWLFRDILKEKHGLRIKKTVGTRGGIKNDMTGTKNYVFGRGNVLIAGEANGIIEGINSAMNTGKAAGEAILESIKTGKSALECFIGNKLLIAEKERGENLQADLEAKLGYNLYRRE
jgi:flavin-dependent dehydrogenase